MRSWPSALAYYLHWDAYMGRWKMNETSINILAIGATGKLGWGKVLMVAGGCSLCRQIVLLWSLAVPATFPGSRVVEQSAVGIACCSV